MEIRALLKRGRRTGGVCAIAASVLACIAVVAATAGSSNDAAALRRQTFEVVWSTAAANFVDPAMNGVDWHAARDAFAAKAEAAQDDVAFAEIVNQMLALLKTSHTRYMPADDPLLPVLLDVFVGNPDLKTFIANRYGDSGPEIEGVGVFTLTSGGKTFIEFVLDGSPAARAGLKPGDEIVTADGAPFHPTRSFKGQAGRELTVSVRRAPDAALQDIKVQVERAGALAAIDAASKASVRLIARDGRKIAYARFWSLARSAPEDVLAEIPLTEADALILDVRGLVGGGGPQLLDALDPRSGQVCSTVRSGVRSCAASSFRGRTVLLVDHHTRSAAEILAHGFRRDRFGVILGTPTAGAVSGGRMFPMPDGGALYVAVVSLSVDGKILEGIGVPPDVSVSYHVPYANGIDPQFEAAVRAASELAKQPTTGP